jgi:RNA polymerase sigma-70 factor (sigma-E family)
VIRPKPQTSFVEFVEAQSDALLRAAWLLTGDVGRAEDLLQRALAKAWRHWRSVERAGSPEAYVRRIIFTSYVSWWRRRWHGEVPSAHIPEQPAVGDLSSEIATRDAVRQALGRLSRRSRAIVVLRYVQDMPIAEVAKLLGCTPSTVKVQASRAMAALRDDPGLRQILEGVHT